MASPRPPTPAPHCRPRRPRPTSLASCPVARPVLAALLAFFVLPFALTLLPPALLHGHRRHLLNLAGTAINRLPPRLVRRTCRFGARRRRRSLKSRPGARPSLAAARARHGLAIAPSKQREPVRRAARPHGARGPGPGCGARQAMGMDAYMHASIHWWAMQFVTDGSPASSPKAGRAAQRAWARRRHSPTRVQLPSLSPEAPMTAPVAQTGSVPACMHSHGHDGLLGCLGGWLTL